MSNLEINNFGTLTTSTKQLVKLDKNKDGVIDEKDKVKLPNEDVTDKVEIRRQTSTGNVPANEDKTNFLALKDQLLDMVKAKDKQISIDFAGKDPKYITQMQDGLKEFAENFATENEANLELAIKEFTLLLEIKYNKLKTELLADDPETIKSNVVDKILNKLVNNDNTKSETNNNSITPEMMNRFGRELYNEATRFIKTYTGTNLAVDLEAHLLEFLQASDSEKIESAIAEYHQEVGSLKGFLDNGNDLKALKEFATKLLKTALNNGVVLEVNGVKINTTARAENVIKGYTDAPTLKADIDEALAKINTQPLQDKLVEEEKQKAEDAIEKNFTSIKGTNYQVSAEIIDYTQIDGYFNNGEITTRGKGRSGAVENGKNKARELLNGNLRDQIKAQIENMLKEKGIPFDKIDQIFNNVFNKSINETLDTEELINAHGAHGLSKKGTSHINIKNLVDKFIQIFNTNIVKEIDDTNKSNKDFDISDLDFSKAGIDEATGKNEKLHGKTIEELYNNNETISDKFFRHIIYKKQAEKLITRMEPQFRTKAKAMCKANNISFNEAIFTALYNNAKGNSIDKAITEGKNLHDKSTLNIKILLDNLATEFQKNYTAWVNQEKTNDKK